MTEDDLIQVECQKINPFLNFMVLIRLHFNKTTLKLIYIVFGFFANENWYQLLNIKNLNFNSIEESANNTNVIDAG